jgi:O-antigen/teichoic acid export membrane protein
VGSALVDQAVISGCGFLFSVLVYRRGGLDDFGFFSLAMSLMVLATNAHGALVTNPLTVLLPEYADGDSGAYLSRLRRMHRWLPLVLIAVTLPLMALAELRAIAPITAVAAACFMGAEYHRRLCYAGHAGGRALLIDAIGYAPLIAAWWLPWVDRDRVHIEGMAIIAGAACIRWWVGSTMTSERHARAAAPWRDVAVRHISYGRWGLGQCLASWSASQLYVFIVAGMLSIEDSGIMNACLKIVGVANVVLWGLETFLLPRLRKIYLERPLAVFHRRVAMYAAMLFAAVCPLLIPCIFAPDIVLRWIFGADAAERGAVLLPLYAAMYIALTLEIVFTLALSSMKRPQAGFWGHVTCGVLTISLGPFIVAHYGMLGATCALLVNHCLRCAIMGAAFILPARAAADAGDHAVHGEN